MDYFKYNKGELFAEDVNVEKIAQMVGTPVYVQQGDNTRPF
jgi:diaminopimelate decarboxylase